MFDRSCSTCEEFFDTRDLNGDPHAGIFEMGLFKIRSSRSSKLRISPPEFANMCRQENDSLVAQGQHDPFLVRSWEFRT
jgi:hypothetical protein